MINRILRAIRLDFTVFREIAQDRTALKEAALIVVITSFMGALGTAGHAHHVLVGFFRDWMAGILFGWIGWAVLAYLVGRWLFRGKTRFLEMTRVLGYACAPHLLGVFGLIPCLRWISAVIGALLALAAAVLAIREAMDCETGTAILTALISWVLADGIRLIFGLLVG